MLNRFHKVAKAYQMVTHTKCNFQCTKLLTNKWRKPIQYNLLSVCLIINYHKCPGIAAIYNSIIHCSCCHNSKEMAQQHYTTILSILRNHLSTEQWHSHHLEAGSKLCFGHFAFLSPLWGLRDNVRCSSWAHWKVRSVPPITVN